MKLMLLMALFFLISCNFTIEKKKEEAIDLGKINLAALSYYDVRDYVFNPKCVSCHGTAGGISLSDFQSIKSNIDSIVKSIDNGSMPKAPTSPLSEAQKTILKEWINLGMPEGPPNIKEVLEPKFSSIKKLIFDPKCLSCHIEGGEAAKIPLSTIEDLMNSPRELIIPGNAEESGLYISIIREDDKRMPPKSVADKLSEKEIQTIVEWIQKGAKE